jgi:hypothetical protein
MGGLTGLGLPDRETQSPGEELLERRSERLARFGEAIPHLAPAQDSISGDQAVGLEVAQPLGQRLGSDPMKAIDEVGEPLRAGTQVANHEHRPAVADSFQRPIVSARLALIGTAFLWISTASVASSYVEIVGQMIVLGVGMGLTSAPATEAIMGVVPKEKAGIGSAINDATRELGGTLGVAVIGSVFASLYTARLALPAGLPTEAADAAHDSVGGAFIAAQRVADAGLGPMADQLHDAAASAFFAGFAIGCLVAATVALIGAVVAAVFLPAQPIEDADDDTEVSEITPDDTDQAEPALVP